MRRALALLALAACNPRSAPVAEVEAPSVCRAADIPDTAAGRRLGEVLAVFNSTEASVAEDFVARAMSPNFAPAQPPEQLAEDIRGDGSTISLCRVESSSALQITAILEDEGAGPGNEFGWIVVAVDAEGRVRSLAVEHVTREDLSREAALLDDAGVHRVVEDVAEGLADYVFADAAADMATRIRAARDAGEYAGIVDGRTLAWRLGDDLRAATDDQHLAVFFSPAGFPPVDSEWEPSPEDEARMREAARADDFGVPVAELREAKVGYLVVTSFYPPEVAAEALAVAMSTFTDAEALVIDLRGNRGGGREGVELLTTYLFGSEPVHLYDVHHRGEGRVESSTTHPESIDSRFGPSKPIYVLTSRSTISAGESFAYNLQAYARATIVGEVTGGAAHSTDVIPVSEHWAVALPTGRPVHPVTKTNWEGTGVTPDVEVPAAQALDAALKLAREDRT